jgi:hypothetical protein
MSERFFRINPNNTVSLAYEDLNPSEVEDLIEKLKGQLWVMKQKPAHPASVIMKSIRLDRVASKITFKFSWDGESQEIDLDDPDGPCIPFPDVPMSEEEWADARRFLLDCVEGV